MSEQVVEQAEAIDGTGFLVMKLVELEERLAASESNSRVLLGLLGALGSTAGLKLDMRQMPDGGNQLRWERQVDKRIILPS